MRDVAVRGALEPGELRRLADIMTQIELAPQKTIFYERDPADIVVNLHHAHRRPEFRRRHYACFHTGPSATANIEGVLIHGAQGVHSLSVLPVAREAGNPIR